MAKAAPELNKVNRSTADIITCVISAVFVAKTRERTGRYYGEI